MTRTAAEIADMLGGKRSGRQYLCCCPAHDDHSPSLIVFDGREQVQVRCLAGCENIDVLRAINALGRDQLYTGPMKLKWLGREDDDDREAKLHTKLALRIWLEAIDPRGTLAEAYLKARGLMLPDGVSMCAVRYHPCCPRGHDVQPALVVKMCCTETNEALAIQRIYLKPDATKDGALMLGPAGGCAMKLTSHIDTYGQEFRCPNLYVCEGFETGVALLMRGIRPVWALGSAGAIAGFTDLVGVEHVTVCADHDDAGLRAARHYADKMGDDSYVTIWVPEHQGTDFADAFKRGGVNDKHASA